MRACARSAPPTAPTCATTPRPSGPRPAACSRCTRATSASRGSTSSVDVAELATLGVPVVADTGSGLLAPHPLLPDEPDAASALRAGAAVVTASGDKLLGGPQAGLLLGRADVVERLRRHPLARALRVDKLALAALEATLRGPVTPDLVGAAGRPGRPARAVRGGGGLGRRRRSSPATARSAAAAHPGRRCPAGRSRCRRRTPRPCAPATRASSGGSSATGACWTCGAWRRATTSGSRPRCRGPRGGAVVHVVATAGHVDHGKSTLVRALTGMEPDRWAEERRRGMTIDLGYAWAALPGGEVLAFVDVPGHQRFIGNMLAGLGPAPAVMVVVAADEGWRRQSGEHLAAVDALGLTAGRAGGDPQRPGRPRAGDRRGARAPARLEPARRRGRGGLGRDRRRARRAARGARPAGGRPAARRGSTAPVRLWVDRSFTVRGSGTVVTGTLGAGVLRTGDELQLGERTVRVRGLQSLGRAYDEVAAVARVAVNLRGVERSDVAPRRRAADARGVGADVRHGRAAVGRPAGAADRARPARRLDRGGGARAAARRRHRAAAAAPRAAAARGRPGAAARPRARSPWRPGCSCSTPTRRRCAGAGPPPCARPTSPRPARCPTSPRRWPGAAPCAGPTSRRSACRSTTCRACWCRASGSSTRRAGRAGRPRWPPPSTRTPSRRRSRAACPPRRRARPSGCPTCGCSRRS